MNIKNNHFYRTQVISEAVAVKPQFRDLPPSTETTLEFKGGVDVTAYVLSGSVPSAPKFGNYELDGGEFKIYVSGVNMSRQPSLPNLSLYRVKPGITIDEGGMTVAHATGTTTEAEVGQKMAVFNAHISADQIDIEENFDGADKSLGEVLLLGSQGNSTLTLADAYVTPKDGADKIHFGGGSYPMNRNVETNLKKYFTNSAGRIPVMAKDKNKKTGMWTATEDNRPNKWQFYEPYWKWEDIKGILRFEQQNPSTTNPDTEPEPTENNTILNHFYTTPNINNPYSADSNNPVVLSQMSLSTDKAMDGPQSLRIYHLFDWSDQNQKVNMNFGTAGWGPQVGRASLTPIPFPWMNSFGGKIGDYLGGDPRSTVPKLEMSMNINKIGNVVNIKPCYATGSNVESGLGEGWSPYAQAYVASGSNKNNENNTFARSVVITFSNHEPDVDDTTLDRFLYKSLNNFYTNTGSNKGRGKNLDIVVLKPNNGYAILRGFNDVSNDYVYAFPLPVTKYGVQMSDDVGNRGMVNSGSLYFFKGSGTWAQHSGTATTAGALIGILPEMRQFVSGTEANAFGGNYGKVGLNEYITDTLGIGFSQGPIALPIGSFFNMTFTFDPYQAVSCRTNSTQPYDTYKRGGTEPPLSVDPRDVATNNETNPTDPSPPGLAEKTMNGSPIRCWFTDAPRPSGSDDDITKNIPYIDIPFPASGQYSAANGQPKYYNFYDMVDGAVTTDGPNNLWPYCMTVWVNNHRWVGGTTDSTPGLTDGNPYPNLEKPYFISSVSGTAVTGLTPAWNDEYINSSGSTMEAEVFIDGIKLKNFNYDVSNASATKGPFSREIRFEGERGDTFLGKNIAIEFGGTSGDGGMYPVWGAGQESNSSTGQDPYDVLNALSISGSAELNSQTALGQVVSLGFNNKTDLPLGLNGVDSTDGRGGFILMNDFNTDNFQAMGQMVPGVANNTGSGSLNPQGLYGQISLASAGQNSGKLGGNVLANAYNSLQNTTWNPSAYGDSAMVQLAFPVSSATGNDIGSAGCTSGIYFGEGTNTFLSTDGLTQKGLVKLYVSGSDYSNWTKRENLFASAKITGIPELKEVANFDTTRGNVITVDNPDIFDNDPDSQYMIYLIGDKLSDTSKRAGYSNMKITLDQDSSITGGAITLKQTNSSDVPKKLGLADNNSNLLLSYKNLPYLYISPVKYWINLTYTTDDVVRTYTKAVMINEDASDALATLTNFTGSTYNEQVYSYDSTLRTSKGQSGIYLKPWSLDVSGENSSLVNNIDYGFGTYDPETNTGGELGTTTAVNYTWAEFDITKLVTTSDDITYDSNFLVKLQLAQDTDDRDVTVIGDEYSDVNYKPLLTWSYKDELPIVRNFKASPAFNLIAKNINLYEITNQDLNGVQFNWEEEADDDVWYRHLFINDVNIPHKYTNAKFHIPLNESGSLTTQPSYKYYKYRTDGGRVAYTMSSAGAGIRANIEGLQGYAAQLASGTTLYITDGSDTSLKNLQKYALTLHATPPSGSYPTNRLDLFGKGTDVTDGFRVSINSSGKIDAVQSNKTISGSTIIPFDGETPVNVTVTYESGSNSGRDLKLYVNGSLEDYESAVDPVTSTADTTIGYASDGSSHWFTGKMEEIVLYELDKGTQDLVVVDTNEEYIYNTANLNDLTGNNVLTHQARLYVMDYHNIRGTADTQVCSTNQTSWRASPP